MLQVVKMQPFKYCVKAACIVEENNEYSRNDYTVKKIRNNKYSLEYVQSPEFAVYYHCQQQRKNKLGDSDQKIPAAVFEH